MWFVDILEMFVGECVLCVSDFIMVSVYDLIFNCSI